MTTSLDLERLRERARALDAAPQRPLGPDPQSAMVVAAGGERCALPLSVVRGVVRLGHLGLLPGARPEVAGLVAHRGSPVPAFHLRAVLDLRLTALPELARLVWIGQSVVEAGLVVDEVLDVVEVGPSSLHPVPEAMSPRARRLFSGLFDGIPVVSARALLESDVLYVDPCVAPLSSRTDP